MGIFDKIFGRKEEYKAQAVNTYFQMLNGYTPIFSTWDGGLYESELCRAAIDATARHISKLNIEMHGTAKPKLQNLFLRAPNTFQTWSQFLYRTSTILDVTNNCFIVPVLDEYGEISGIYPIYPQAYELVQTGDNTPYLRFTFSTGRKAAVELSKVGILTKHQLGDDFFGSPNRPLIPTLELIDIQRQCIEEGAKNSATFRFMAKTSNFVKPEDLAKERDEFTENNLKKGNGGMLLFPNTFSEIKQIDTKPYTVNPEEREQIRTAVFDYFGTNEKIVQSKANDEELDSFFNSRIEPFAIQLSDVLNGMLYSINEIARGNRIYVASNRLMYMSISHKTEMVKILSDRGAIKIDEIRALFNYPPLPDGAGEKAPARGEYYDIITGKEE